MWKTWLQRLSVKEEQSEGKDGAVDLIWRLKLDDQKKEIKRVL